ncbi:MAG: hypothetical protein LUD81_11240 [Clostridiales bacterium]|nr:hypothetical protein [Clostridiales bacterium]
MTDIEDINKYLNGIELDKSRGENEIKVLRRYRGCLLEDIHTQQQCLDRIDYLIYEIEKHKGDF